MQMHSLGKGGKLITKETWKAQKEMPQQHIFAALDAE